MKKSETSTDQIKKAAIVMSESTILVFLLEALKNKRFRQIRHIEPGTVVCDVQKGALWRIVFSREDPKDPKSKKLFMHNPANPEEVGLLQLMAVSDKKVGGGQRLERLPVNEVRYASLDSWVFVPANHRIKFEASEVF